MRAALRLAGLAVLLLLVSCAQRTYVVFPPDRATPPPPNSCILDFSDIGLRSWTVARLRQWADDAAAKADCGGLRLAFHRPGDRMKGRGFDAPDDYLVVGIGLDSAPERPALKYPPIIRVIVEPPPPGTITDARPWVCPDHLRCVPPHQVCTAWRCPRVTRMIGRLVIPPAELSFAIPESPTPTPDPPGGPPDTPGDPPDDKDDPGKDPEKPRQPGGPRTIEEALPPALIGGGLVYALALLKMLPFAGGGPAPFRPGPGQSWGGQETPPPAPFAPASGGTAEPSDPRVRLGERGFLDERR